MSISTLKYRFWSLPGLVLSLLLPFAQPALADSNAGVSLSEPFVTGLSASDYQLNSATPATASLLGVTGIAKSNLATGSTGVAMELLPGSLFGFYSANAGWNDFWTSSGSTNVGATLTLSGQISESLFAFSDDFWEITFRYSIDGNHLLSFDAFGDSSAAHVTAFDKDGNPIPINWTLNPTSRDFSISYSPTFFTTGAFSEAMEASIMVDGSGPMLIDASHSFHAALVSLDPGVTLTDEAGRSVAAIPEPETYAMLLAGLGLLGLAARRRKQNSPAAT